MVFRASVEFVKNEKKLRNETQVLDVHTNVDKRKILETFIENDEALGQLLDFISAKNIKPDSIKAQEVSMSMINKQGNRNTVPHHHTIEAYKFNTNSAIKS